jgi:DNA-binding CsgD family transcriptional regulator/tetratricopeptide (TPR) repeat protein
MDQSGLVERSAAIQILERSLGRARSGHSSVVLVSGEAGVGKTALIREFIKAAQQQAEILTGACEDLVAPRPLGPIRDAARSRAALTHALMAGDVDQAMAAVLAELSNPEPVVLVIEDLHWADDASLDVIGHLARRLDQLTTQIVLSYREDAVSVLPPSHALHRVLGTIASSSSQRLQLKPLSQRGVARIAEGSTWDPTSLHDLTGGNPFFVTEVLASPGEQVPQNVADAVMARVANLGTAARHALEQLSIVPTQVDLALAERLLGKNLTALSEAERLGVVVVRDRTLTFRHELARRAVEANVPHLARISLHRNVIKALHDDQQQPDLARIVHHAIEAGDRQTVATYAPRAGREAVKAGSHREALAHFTAALTYPEELSVKELAQVTEAHAWELHNGHEFGEAVEQSNEAVRLFRQLGDRQALGSALVRSSRCRYLNADTYGARQAAEEALTVLVECGASPTSVAAAMTQRATILALLGDPQAASALNAALESAQEAECLDLVALCLNYRSIADPDLSEQERIATLHESLSLARQIGAHEVTARAYTNLGELLYRYLRFDELAMVLDEGLTFTRQHGFWSHAYNLEVHQNLLLWRLGDSRHAEASLAKLVERNDESDLLSVYSGPALGRALARRQHPHAYHLLKQAWAQAQQQQALVGLAYAGAGLAEWAWLNNRPELLDELLTEWVHYAHRPTAAPAWAEIVRYAARAGVQVSDVPNCRDPWAFGIEGNWPSAVSAWHQIGDRYERALELAESGDPNLIIESLAELEDLTASAAIAWVLPKLKALGIQHRPRRKAASTRANPARLTARQLEVVALLAEGLTNAEIANRLVVSVRTVESHVAAALAKTDAVNRIELVEAFHMWRATPE